MTTHFALARNWLCRASKRACGSSQSHAPKVMATSSRPSGTMPPPITPPKPPMSRQLISLNVSQYFTRPLYSVMTVRE